MIKPTGLEGMDMPLLVPQLIGKPDSSPTEYKELTATENLHLT